MTLNTFISIVALGLASCTLYTTESDGDRIEGDLEADAGWDRDGGRPGSDGGAFDGGVFDGGAHDGGPAGDAGTCASITDEAVCIVTAGCNALYRGDGCACQMGGVCSCDDYLFVGCE